MSTLLEEGKTYFWCSCGRSDKQPFCDGSHKETAFSPVKYGATSAARVNFCGCKQTKTPPFCDGSHSALD
jgi:CDGSH-type Zn-finger protein